MHNSSMSDVPPFSPEEVESVAILEILEMLGKTGRSERDIIDVLVAWANAYGDIEGMDREDTAIYERLLAIRNEMDSEV